MKIIFSPTKTMRKDCDNHSSNTIPMFINKTSELLVMMKGFDCKQLEKIYRCSEKIANDNYLLFQNMDLYNDLTQAVNCYCGISYKYLASSLMNQNQLSYLNDHLRILSGFYGILRPFDGIREYRLDFDCMSDLYQFWSDLIYKEMFKDKEVIINLASKEYSVLLEKYLQSDDKLINVDFLHLEKDVKMIHSSADYLHLDIMDGTLVPNISFGFPIVEAVSKAVSIPLDAHLMVVNPQKWFSRLSELGVEMVSFHLEATGWKAKSESG